MLASTQTSLNHRTQHNPTIPSAKPPAQGPKICVHFPHYGAAHRLLSHHPWTSAAPSPAVMTWTTEIGLSLSLSAFGQYNHSKVTFDSVHRLNPYMFKTMFISTSPISSTSFFTVRVSGCRASHCLLPSDWFVPVTRNPNLRRRHPV